MKQLHSVLPARVGMGILTYALLTAWGSEALAGPAGKFIYAFGEVNVTSRSGENRPAAKGQILNEGDLISSGADGSAQIRLNDDGMLAVRANTKVRIDEFRYQGKQDGSERSALSLLQGGLRAITGAVGSANKQNYRISTPTATIGIRGTDHEPFFVPNGAHPFGNVQPGTYDKVNTGEAYIQTPLGIVAINPNQVGFAGASNAKPVLLPAVPTLFKATPEAKPEDNKGDKKSSDDSGNKETSSQDEKKKQGAGKPPPPPPVANVNAPKPPPIGPDNRPIQAPIEASAGGATVDFTNQQITGANGQPVNGNTPLTWPGAIPVVAGAADDTATQQIGAGSGVESGMGVQADLYGRLLRIQNTDGFSFDHGTAKLAEVGRSSLPIDGGKQMPVVWGRWQAEPPANTFVLMENGQLIRPLGSMHYAVAPIVTPFDQLNASNLGFKGASYRLMASTQPSSEQPGAVGTLQALDMLVDFASQQIVDYKLKLAVSGRSYSAFAAQRVPLGQEFWLPLNVSCSGCNISLPLKGEANGAFIGPKAEGVVTSYALGKNSTEYSYGAAILALNDTAPTIPAAPNPGPAPGTAPGTNPGPAPGTGPAPAPAPGTDPGSTPGTGTGPAPGPAPGTSPGTGTGLPVNASMVIVGADMEKTAAGNFGIGAGVHMASGLTFDPNGNLIGINEGQFAFAAHTASLVESGSTQLPIAGGQQKINWGRWEAQSSTSTFQVSNNNLLKNSVGSFHFLAADQLSSATSLSAATMGGISATYSAIAGSTPTSEIFGESGHLAVLKATVDFTQQKITDYQIKVDFADRSFKASGGGVAIAPTFNIGLSGNCQGCSSANPSALIPVGGQASGAFIGPKAEGMVSSYGLQTQIGDRAVSGVAVMQR